jgi:hypothetical protein
MTPRAEVTKCPGGGIHTFYEGRCLKCDETHDAHRQKMKEHRKAMWRMKTKKRHD